ncbi:MAG: squalene/phytoene synthase family protein [Nitrospirae bacterium]|nr:squalene/phytoene synthase family protein [Nitrospirota bacterium]
MTPDQAYRHCHTLTRRAGPNFSVGFRFLPKDKRRATEAAYAFCRYLDDQVDLPGAGNPEERLKEWEAELERTYAGRPAHPAGIALADALARYPIPKEAFEGLIAGCRMDLAKTRYETFSELVVYCDLVATTIRDITLAIFGARGEEAFRLGRSFSTALQLTNILRDVGEDLDRGRIYLPCEERERFGITEEALFARRVTPEFAALMKFSADRARGFFREGMKIVPFIDADARLATRLRGEVYLRLLDEIERRNYDVFTGKIRLPPWAKARIVLQTLLTPKDYSGTNHR